MRRRPLRTLWLALAAGLAIALGPATVTPAVAAAPFPHVMAATGDSITRAFDVGWCCVLQDSPSRSWSTGTSSSVYSHYRRLLTVDSGLAGHAYNDARSGAKMADLAGQLGAAASQRADYATVLMGANDVCTSSLATMTPTATFEAQFRTALSAFVAARPKARVFVASIPDIYRLWSVFHNNILATTTWKYFKICQSMLNSANTEEQRQQVVQREIADNEALARVCAEFTQCLWDGYAVYKTQFSASDVSTVDYFHPSVSGQDRLARVTWSVGYWPWVG
jgi:lysophospholipase L1-like esterase